ncbi:galectin-6-like isoform X2 [Ischnura elegans]|uniref:galectin-6-like isoform X2 n=1 Tax=Ischnura elegans TaxID=197161 RepID=UPI001ED89109|nr:galectin-6-like isoform X2 [Ischnura elegans]
MSLNCKEFIALFSCIPNYDYGMEESPEVAENAVYERGRRSSIKVEEAEEVDEDFIVLPEYPSKGQIVNPRLPYVGALPKPLTIGHTIVIDATVLPEAKRFSVNLVCGISDESDYALHFNPRFERNYVVRNCKIGGTWGDEECTSPQSNPFKRGMPFHLYIFVAKNAFLIAVDGNHFCGYGFRLPLSRIHSVHVRGDLSLSGIEHRDCSVYPVPGTGEPAITIPVPTDSCPCTTTDEEKVFCSQHIIMPDVPFYGHLPNGIALESEIEIIGRVKPLPHSFYVNLQRGRQTFPHPEVALHINPRFQSEERLILNSWVKKDHGWGEEVCLHKNRIIFRPGSIFNLVIKVSADHYYVFVNSKQVAKYVHRGNPLHVDTVHVQGDVVLQHVYSR